VNQGGAVLRTTVQMCLLVGAGAFLLLGVSGHAGTGLAFAAGLGIGAANGYMARRTLGLRLSFWATSLARLMVLGTAAVGLSLLFGPGFTWVVLLGVGAAQLVMVGVAFKQAVRA